MCSFVIGLVCVHMLVYVCARGRRGVGGWWLRGVGDFAQVQCEEVTAEDLGEDESMAMCVATLKYLKGNFKRHDREEEYLYDALALTQRTGEKQQASPMELVSEP